MEPLCVEAHVAGHVVYTYTYIYVYIYRSVGLPTEGQSEVITRGLLLTSGEKIYFNSCGATPGLFSRRGSIWWAARWGQIDELGAGRLRSEFTQGVGVAGSM